MLASLPLFLLFALAPLLVTCSKNSPAAACTIDSTVRPNQATWYTSNPNEVGSCSYALNATPPGTIGAAAADSLFVGSQGCGTCYQLVGTAATVLVQVADYCPGCPATAMFDLLDSTLQTLMGGPPGIGSITYQQVNCPITGNIKIEADSGTNPYYLKARVLNHRNPVAKMELKVSGSYQTMKRSTDNAFDISPGILLPTPYELRLTDTYGFVIEESVTVSPGNKVDGTHQFPTCS